LTDAPPADGNGDWAAIAYTSKSADRAVLYAFRLQHGDLERTFAIPGLDLNAHYRITSFEGATQELSGRALASGFQVSANEPFRALLFSMERL
jgi:hypothetical protein